MHCMQDRLLMTDTRGQSRGAREETAGWQAVQSAGTPSSREPRALSPRATTSSPSLYEATVSAAAINESL